MRFDLGTHGRRVGTPALVCSLLAGVALGACGGSPETKSGSDLALGGSAGAAGSLGMGGGIVIDGNGGGPGGSGTITDLGLTIGLDSSEISVNGAPVSIELGVSYEDGSTPNGAVWSVDDTTIGSVDQNGVFTANGWVAGTVTVTVTVGSQSTSIEI